jgi:stromal membrane-associated protein
MSDRARAAQIRRLEACLALPENRECFDCGALRPRWASTNLGIFVCMRCAGIHRSLGTHISKVKSINMDVWDEEMIRNCETIGNGPEGKWRYEANMPASYTKPKMTAENREVEGYIRLKFESKAYYPRPDQHGPTASAVHHEPAHHAPPPATQAHTAAHATAHHAPAAQPAHPAQGRVIQAVPMETAKPVAQQEPDLFGAFAASRSAPPAQQAAPQPAAAAAAALKPVANTDFFGQAAAPSSGQAQSPNFFGSPSPPQNGSPDFFGTGPVMQTSHQQQKQHHAPPAPPAPPTDFFSGGAATTNHNQHHAQQPDIWGTPQQAPQQQHGAGFHSMYQKNPVPILTATQSGPDPFLSLAGARPKTPPKHYEPPTQSPMHPTVVHAPASVPDPFSGFGDFSQPTAAPPAKKKDDFNDFFN